MNLIDEALQELTTAQLKYAATGLSFYLEARPQHNNGLCWWLAEEWDCKNFARFDPCPLMGAMTYALCGGIHADVIKGQTEDRRKFAAKVLDILNQEISNRVGVSND